MLNLELRREAYRRIPPNQQEIYQSFILVLLVGSLNFSDVLPETQNLH
jgi:hypothetical protein